MTMMMMVMRRRSAHSAQLYARTDGLVIVHRHRQRVVCFRVAVVARRVVNTSVQQCYCCVAVCPHLLRNNDRRITLHLLLLLLLLCIVNLHTPKNCIGVL